VTYKEQSGEIREKLNPVAVAQVTFISMSYANALAKEEEKFLKQT